MAGRGVGLIGVVGAGQMGAGIAQVAAAAGQLPVVLMDVNEAALARGIAGIAASLGRFVAKGAISRPDADAALARVATTTAAADLRDADVVIEAAPESEPLKRRIFAELDRVVKPSALLATNTSSISITGLAACTARPARVVGIHFMNPPPLMRLVEIVRGLQTDDAAFEAARALAEALGKTVISSRDAPGFVVNRVLMPMVNEAFFALHEGVAAAEDIDTALKLGTNQPMGPLALADFIGLDTCLAILRVLHAGIGDDKYRPCPLLVRFVEAGWLGRKAGRGVYVYHKPG